MSKAKLTTAAAAIILLVNLAGAAGAAWEDEAGPFVEDIGNRAVAVFVDGSTSQNQKAERFSVLFRENFAIRALAAFTLGRYYKKSDTAFLDEFVEVFDEYVGRSYAARFSGDQSPIFEVVEVVPDHNPDGKRVGVRVTTHVFLPGGDPTPVEWRVREYQGRPIIVDVIAGGISLAITQQREFTAVISNHGGDLNALLDLLRKKNIELTE